jgi:hypothetical protein
MYAEEVKKKSAIYFGKQIKLEEVLLRLSQYVEYL